MTITRNQTNTIRVCLDGEVGAAYTLNICSQTITLTLVSVCKNCILFDFDLTCDERAGTYRYELNKDGVFAKSGNITIQ